MHTSTWVSVGQREDGTYVIWHESNPGEQYAKYKRRALAMLPVKKDFEVMSRAHAANTHPTELALYDESPQQRSER